MTRMTRHNKNRGIGFKHIKSQKDIAMERLKLKMELSQNKAALNHSITSLKEEFNPIANIVGTVQNVAHADTNHPLIGLGMSFISDKLVKNVFLKKSGWLKKMLVPVLVKKISTYAVANIKSEGLANALHKAANILRK